MPDACQQEVIDAQRGMHLVLAPPGCGKTQILTERIRKAHDEGVAFEDMLCLTFTNRAARGMADRISANITDEGAADVYVGNVHRFCSRFLFSNGIVAAESSVIDDEDALSILARIMGDDEYDITVNNRRRREYAEVMQLSVFMYQIRHGHPKELRIHPECLKMEDISALRKICEVQRMTFDAKAMTDIYDNTSFYREASDGDGYDYGTKAMISTLLRKMSLAHQYEEYKRTNRLLDFEDLLVMTYDTLRADSTGEYRRYPWIQVDEVQDLNRLQLAIIDELGGSCPVAVMYLGDEQQAIFSFMGAKTETLGMLKRRCDGNIHHLNVNHRSPAYMLDVFNTYASKVLGIDSSLLPSHSFDVERSGDELKILSSENYDSEVRDVVETAEKLFRKYEDQTTAVIVNANRDADLISTELTEHGISHFKVSGSDLFSSPEVKLLLAHLNILANGNNFIAWARMLKGLKVFAQNSTARRFVRGLLDRAISPSDLVEYDADGTYLQEFVSVYDNSDIVIFDTETTGLNVFEDDIVQIAAVKMRRGKIVEGSALSLFIATDREIPRMLGDVENPIIEEMRHHELLDRKEALLRFMDYVGDSVLLGHNADYDYNILENNLKRCGSGVELRKRCPRYLDSLRLVRLLEPELKEHKLKYLLAVLGLEGSNSHLADEDVAATCSVVNHCYGKARTMIEEQRRFLNDRRVADYVSALRRRYAEFYRRARHTMYDRGRNGDRPVLVGEMLHFYDNLVDNGTILPVRNIDYIVGFLSADVIDASEYPSLAEQLGRYMMEINTFKEADLCNSASLKERIFVTTIHKAKGLEFDNVIVFDAIEGRIPNFFSLNDRAMMEEDARKFYVAISRAKRRLYVSYCTTRRDYHNEEHRQYLTRFMIPLQKLFD